jgi:hypothetical protein
LLPAEDDCANQGADNRLGWLHPYTLHDADNIKSAENELPPIHRCRSTTWVHLKPLKHTVNAPDCGERANADTVFLLLSPVYYTLRRGATAARSAARATAT